MILNVDYVFSLIYFLFVCFIVASVIFSLFYRVILSLDLSTLETF